MKIAVLLCGHVRSWNKQYFINSFGTDFDVFIHTYNNVLVYHPFIENQICLNDNNEKLSIEKIIDIIGLKPKIIIVEDQDKLNTVSKDYPLNPTSYYEYRKFKLCNDLRLAYEKENNFKYDVVIKTRFDIIYSLTLPMMLDRLKNKEHIYISEGPSVYPCDQIFIAKEELITNLANSLIDMTYKKKIKNKIPSHEWLLFNSGGILEILYGLQTHIITINLI